MITINIERLEHNPIINPSDEGIGRNARYEYQRPDLNSGSVMGSKSAWAVLPLFRLPSWRLYSIGVCREYRRAL